MSRVVPNVSPGGVIHPGHADDMERVVDLGAGDDPDSRATETADSRPVGDHQFDLDEEWPLRDSSIHGLISNHSFEHVTDPQHFFAEAGRVLKPRGYLEITVPIGKNALADDDHERTWQWTTPEHYCRKRQRGWDPVTEFELEDRQLDADLHGFLSPLNLPFQLLATVSPGEATYRCSAGELTATYRRLKTGGVGDED